MKDMAWLASYPKSGNTWVRLLMSAYLTGRSDINAIMCSTNDTYHYPYQAVAPKQFDQMEGWEWAACACAAALHVPLAIRERPLLIKTHHANLQPFGYTVIPHLMCEKAIYLIRDPRDVAISYAKHIGASIDAAISSMGDDTTLLVKEGVPPQFICSWSQHVSSWLNHRSIEVMGVRYEDLTERPVDVFAGILRFLEESPNTKRVEKAVELTNLENLRQQEEKHGFAEASEQNKFFGQGGSTWRAILSHAQINRITSDHGDLMNALGYQTLEVAA